VLLKEVGDLSTQILHQAAARIARRCLVRVSAALCATETRQLKKVQDVILKTAEFDHGAF